MITKIHDLNLHEETKVTADMSVMRVPGGWVYRDKHGMTFVPYADDTQSSMSYEERFAELKRKLERNLGEDWTKATQKDIIDVFLGVYIPF